MNKKIGRVLILLLIGCVIGFGILYQTWGGNPESKLNKTTLLENTMITNSSFDSILGTTWINQKNDTSSSEVSFTIESSPKYTKGIFENFDIIFKVSEDDPSKSKLRVTIDVSSINTDNEMRDENLMDEDYFSFNDFPKISFQSNEILKTDSSYWASGLIDMMGFKMNYPFTYF